MTEAEEFAHAEVVLCPGGPLLLRGEHRVQDPNGSIHVTARPVTAICRCGKSSVQPWCDGTHKIIDPKMAP